PVRRRGWAVHRPGGGTGQGTVGGGAGRRAVHRLGGADGRVPHPLPPYRRAHPRAGGSVTVVYRAYSPSRDEATRAQEDRGYVQGVAATRNQRAAVTPEPADWTVQTGHIEWEQA